MPATTTRPQSESDRLRKMCETRETPRVDWDRALLRGFVIKLRWSLGCLLRELKARASGDSTDPEGSNLLKAIRQAEETLAETEEF